MMHIGRRLAIASLAALAAALVAAAALAVVYSRSPAIRFEMDRDQVQALSGFYPSERDRDADLRLDRRVCGNPAAGPGSPRAVDLHGQHPRLEAG